MAFSAIFFLLVVPLTMGLTIAMLLKRRRQHVLETRQALLARAERIAATYPDEVQAWGGKPVLLNAEVVREIVASLETDRGTPSAL